MAINSEDFRGVTFSQFDNRVGPQLVFSYPLNVISKEDFDILSDYVIVGKHLCNKVITIQLGELQFLNYSIAVENPKYERNTIMFSFGIILTSLTSATPFEKVLKKVSETFVNLELESEFVFNDKTKSLIHKFLEILYHQLINYGETYIEIDESTILTAKLFHLCKEPRIIESYEVPLLLVDPYSLGTVEWDITIRHVIQFINGDNSVVEISNCYPGIDIDITKQALRSLLYYKCILITDKLRFSNIYHLTHFGEVLTSTCREERDPSIISNNKNTLVKLAEFSKINSNSDISIQNCADILSSFTNPTNLASVVISYQTHLKHLDLHKFMSFAQYHNIVQRIHEYPIDLKNLHSGTLIPVDFSSRLSFEKGHKMLKRQPSTVSILLNGEECLDSICIKYKVTPKSVLSQKGVTVIYK